MYVSKRRQKWDVLYYGPEICDGWWFIYWLYHFWLSWAEGCSQISISTEAHFESKLKQKTKKLWEHKNSVSAWMVSCVWNAGVAWFAESSLHSPHPPVPAAELKNNAEIFNDMWPCLTCFDSSEKMWLRRLCRSTQLWLQNFQFIFLKLKIIWFTSSSGKWMKQNTCRVELHLSLEPGVLKCN